MGKIVYIFRIHSVIINRARFEVMFPELGCSSAQKVAPRRFIIYLTPKTFLEATTDFDSGNLFLHPACYF